MTPQHQVADALRTVALRLERALEEGRRSTTFDAEDLRETLLAVADELDPPAADKAGPALLDAARPLLEARDEQMVTQVEWDRLREAVQAAERHR